MTLRFALSGEEPKDVRENHHCFERSSGTFSRPRSVDAEKIRAEAKNGVLSVHLPKRAEARPRAIQVKVS